MADKIRLFFTAGKVPTAQEREQAEALGMTCFRNAVNVGAMSALEAAVEVAGSVPERYRSLKGCKVLAVGPTAAAIAAQAEADALKAKQNRR